MMWLEDLAENTKNDWLKITAKQNTAVDAPITFEDILMTVINYSIIF